MSNSISGVTSTWSHSASDQEADAMANAWQATRAATQIQGYDEEAAAGPGDIGRAVGNDQRELFVSCDAGQAMEQQFEHLKPEFIALHDVETRATRKLLSGIAQASRRQMQRLVIRRQGYGTTLATIEFVDLPTPSGKALRLYSTDVEAEPFERRALVRALLAHSRLGVLLVGNVPPASLPMAFEPLRRDITAGHWLNRHLLLLPLGGGNGIVQQGAELARATGIHVQTSPAVVRPAEAWQFIAGAWGRMQEGGASPASTGSSSQKGSSAASATPPSYATTRPTPLEPLTMRPMPAVRADNTAEAEDSSVVLRYVNRLVDLPGAVSACVFELGTGEPVCHAGASPGADDLAEHGRELMTATMRAARALGMGHAMPEAAITLNAHHLLLKAVPKHPSLVVHVVLDKAQANLTLARLQIGRLEGSLFDDKPAA